MRRIKDVEASNGKGTECYMGDVDVQGYDTMRMPGNGAVSIWVVSFFLHFVDFEQLKVTPWIGYPRCTEIYENAFISVF